MKGIYKIENEKGQIYIGSSKDIQKRFSNHLAKLRKGIYPYPELQESFNQNENNLKWEILDECLEVELKKCEKDWIEYCNMIDGWKVINRWQNKLGGKGEVKDTSNMKKAQSGEKNGNSKISRETAIKIKMMLKMNMKIEDIAELLNDENVTYGIVNNIKSGLRWPDLNIEDYCIGGC